MMSWLPFQNYDLPNFIPILFEMMGALGFFEQAASATATRRTTTK